MKRCEYLESTFAIGGYDGENLGEVVAMTWTWTNIHVVSTHGHGGHYGRTCLRDLGSSPKFNFGLYPKLIPCVHIWGHRSYFIIVYNSYPRVQWALTT